MTISTSAEPTPAAPNPRKKSPAKIILKLFAVLVLLFVVALVLLFLNLNTLVRAGVIRGGHYATDQNTNLNAASLSLSAGSLQLNDFDIDNLKGYSAPKILSMKSCATTVESSSIFSHTVIVSSILIDGLDITLEQNGAKNNLNDLIQILQKKTPAAGDSANASPGKELKIGTLKLTNSKVHIRAAAPFNFNLDLNLPDLELADPTNPDGRPMKIADLIGKILLQLSKQILENPQVPGNIKDAMKDVNAVVDRIRGDLDKNVKQFQNIGKSLTDLGKNINATQGAQNVQQNIQDATKGLQNLLNKKDQSK